MNPNNQDLNVLFDKFLNGQATAEEILFLWKWMFLLDTRQQQILYTRQEKDLIRENMRSKVLQQMQPVRRKYVPLIRYAAAAAVLLLLAAGGFWFMNNGKPDKQPQVSMVVSGDKMRSFYLPDSTEVMLNMASSLKWNSSYNISERKVLLHGEGYFKVHKDSKRPFIVEGNGVLTEALGTAFNIEAYQQESEVRVALIEGAVQVSSTDRAFQHKVLRPGDLLRFAHADSAVYVQKVTAGQAIAWTTGGMSFQSIPLSEVLDRLAVRYHITIQYDHKKLASKKVSGNFRPAPWQELLPNILFIHNLHYEIKDNLIRIN